MTPPENHEKTTFRAFLETKGPRDPPWVQERQILFRIALTRALYDQMAPQLCLFYVPGSGPPVGPPVGPPGGCAGTFGFSACEILISAFLIAAKDLFF